MRRKKDLSVFYDLNADRLHRIFKAGYFTEDEYAQIAIHDAEEALLRHQPKKERKLMTNAQFRPGLWWRTIVVFLIIAILGLAYAIFGAPRAASATDQVDSFPQKGVTDLSYSDGSWTITLASADADEVKLITPAPQEIACSEHDGESKNGHHICDTVSYTFASQAECVEVQVDWTNNLYPSWDPRACQDTPPVDEPPVVIVPEKPAPVVTTGEWTFQSENCDTWISTDGRWVRTTDWTLTDNVWVANSTYSEIIETQTRPAVVPECSYGLPPVLQPPTVDIPVIVPPAALPALPEPVSEVVIPKVGESVSYDVLAETGQTKDRLWATGGLVGSFLLVGTGLLLWIRYERKLHDTH